MAVALAAVSKVRPKFMRACPATENTANKTKSGQSLFVCHVHVSPVEALRFRGSWRGLQEKQRNPNRTSISQRLFVVTWKVAANWAKHNASSCEVVHKDHGVHTWMKIPRPTMPIEDVVCSNSNVLSESFTPKVWMRLKLGCHPFQVLQFHEFNSIPLTPSATLKSTQPLSTRTSKYTAELMTAATTAPMRPFRGMGSAGKPNALMTKPGLPWQRLLQYVAKILLLCYSSERQEQDITACFKNLHLE